MDFIASLACHQKFFSTLCDGVSADTTPNRVELGSRGEAVSDVAEIQRILDKSSSVHRMSCEVFGQSQDLKAVCS